MTAVLTFLPGYGPEPTLNVRKHIFLLLCFLRQKSVALILRKWPPNFFTYFPRGGSQRDTSGRSERLPTCYAAEGGNVFDCGVFHLQTPSVAPCDPSAPAVGETRAPQETETVRSCTQVNALWNQLRDARSTKEASPQCAVRRRRSEVEHVTFQLTSLPAPARESIGWLRMALPRYLRKAAPAERQHLALHQQPASRQPIFSSSG